MNIKIGIVASNFNQKITSVMEKAAEKTAKDLNARVVKKIRVPGAFEIPFAAKQILEKEKIDALVVLGVVIQGQTDHDAVIVNSIAPKLLELSLKHNTPLGFGIIGPRVTRKQSEERAEEYAARAVKTALEMVNNPEND